MRFMMMIKGDEQSEAGVLPDEKLIEAMVRYNDELVKAGALLAAEGLQPSAKGARIRFRGGKPVVTDGPFAEAKEVIAGYWLIEAPSKAEAIEWAKRVPFEAGESSTPSDQGGQIELRQVFELEDFPVNEGESGWREQEAEYRAQYKSPRPAPGLKQFIIFRMADRDTEAGVMPSEELLTAMGQYNEEMIKAGVMLTGEGLQPSAKGARVNYVRGKRTVVDGPFAEAKELIAGFTMIQVKSKEEALEWVKRWPALDGDGEVELELREVFAGDEFAARAHAQAPGVLRSPAHTDRRPAVTRMKYLCLIYYEEAQADALPESEYNAITSEAVEYGEALGVSGNFLASAALQSIETATTIRLRNGKLSITDGPFAETKEQLGGFFLIEARDLNDAIRVASRIPPLRLGCVEVRPIKVCEVLKERQA